MDDIDDSMVY
jgi:hypothetical protein